MRRQPVWSSSLSQLSTSSWPYCSIHSGRIFAAHAACTSALISLQRRAIAAGSVPSRSRTKKVSFQVLGSFIPSSPMSTIASISARPLLAGKSS